MRENIKKVAGLTRAMSFLALGTAALATQPAAAATAPQRVLKPAVLTEYQVTADPIIDAEFDWGRDGCYCPTCNHGQGNNRLVFTDKNQNMWIAYIDPNTGAFSPQNGMGILVDTYAAWANDFGNGPEWMFSSTADSQIVYTKYTPGAPNDAADAGTAIATMAANGTWSGSIIPNGLATHTPIATLNLNDPSPALDYSDQWGSMFLWRLANDPSSEQVVPWSNRTYGNSRRWVSDAHTIIFTTGAPPDATGKNYEQVFTFDTVTQTLTQLTFDPSNKEGAFMWRAPEFNNDYVFFTVANNSTTLQIYRQMDDGTGTGHKVWKLINSINMPATMPYVWSPEPFVHNGKSYVFFQLSTNPNTKSSNFSVPTQIAMTGIDPSVNSFRWLTNDNNTKRVRLDPEYYITSQGPIIYYNRYTLSTSTKPQTQDGVWFAKTNLGAPTNACTNVLPHR